MINKLGRLAHGVRNELKGTNNIYFINKNEVPQHKTPTYAQIVFDIWPSKTKKYRVWIIAGGDCVEYPYELSTLTVEMTTAKLLLNSTISTPNAQFMTSDIKKYFLETPLDTPEYMKILIQLIPQKLITEYKLQDKVYNSYIYIKIVKGMYGLSQANILAYQQLAKWLESHGYMNIKLTPEL